MDLTKINVPFGLLDDVYGPGTAEALRAHGGPYEMFADEGWQARDPGWVSGATYRVKPAPPKPREYWIVEWGRDWEARTSCTSAEGAAEYASDKRDARVTHVREVITE